MTNRPRIAPTTTSTALGTQGMKMAASLFGRLEMMELSVNKSINLVKKGKVKEAEKIIKPVIRYLLKMKCKKIILACTELPVAIFAFKSFKKVKSSRTFFDPNLILAKAAMKKYSLKRVK